MGGARPRTPGASARGCDARVARAVHCLDENKEMSWQLAVCSWRFAVGSERRYCQLRTANRQLERPAVGSERRYCQLRTANRQLERPLLLPPPVRKYLDLFK